LVSGSGTLYDDDWCSTFCTTEPQRVRIPNGDEWTIGPIVAGLEPIALCDDSNVGFVISNVAERGNSHHDARDYQPSVVAVIQLQNYNSPSHQSHLILIMILQFHTHSGTYFFNYVALTEHRQSAVHTSLVIPSDMPPISISVLWSLSLKWMRTSNAYEMRMIVIDLKRNSNLKSILKSTYTIIDNQNTFKITSYGLSYIQRLYSIPEPLFIWVFI